MGRNGPSNLARGVKKAGTFRDVPKVDNVVPRAILATLALFLPALGVAQAAYEPSPDLVATGLWFTTADGRLVEDFVAGDTVYAHARVANHGDGPAGRFFVRFLADGTLWSEAPLGGLPAKTAAALDAASWVVPSGRHEVSVEADVSRKVAESSETNNALGRSVLARSNLRIEADKSSAETLPFGAVVYELRVANLARAPEAVRLSAAGDSVGWSYEVHPTEFVLAPGEARTAWLTVVAEPGGPPATVVAEAVLADAPVVAESIETRTALMP